MEITEETTMATADKATLTTNEVAQILRVSPRHIWNLQKEKLIPSIKVGRAHRYVLEDVLSVLTEDATDK